MIGSPVIIEHQDVTDKNADKIRCGVISDAYFNEPDGWYYAEGIIWDDKAISLINDGWSVSCSYDFLAFNDEGGEENNIKYDKEFTELNFTHLAIVNNPRYERANIVFNSKDEEKGKWVTVKGNHIFIPDGKTLDEVIKEKGWGDKEGPKNKEYKTGDRITFDTNWRGVNPKIQKGEIVGKEKKLGSHGDTNPDYQYKVKLEDGKTILVDKEAIQESENKHGFKKDKDSGYYMKDLSDGTSVYVEKKEGGQGEKEPFFLEATHFDKDGKEIAKKQYHYDSMDGMFSKIDKDFVSKDKSGDSGERVKSVNIKGADGNALSNFTKTGNYKDGDKLKRILSENKNKTLGEIKDLLNKSDITYHNWEIADGFESGDKISDYEEVNFESDLGVIQIKDTTNPKVNNSTGDITMTVLNDLTDFIKKVVKNQKENKMDSKSKILSILNEKEVDKETIEEIKNEIEKIEEEKEEVKNKKKVKNEEEEEVEEKEEEKEVDNEEEDEEKVEELKKEEKKDVENKCKNSKETSTFDKINAIYNSVRALKPQTKYTSRQEKLDNAVEYFKN